jgi:hypothetical protein
VPTWGWYVIGVGSFLFICALLLVLGLARVAGLADELSEQHYRELSEQEQERKSGLPGPPRSP